MAAIPYTQEEIDFIIANDGKPIQWVADQLGRSYHSIVSIRRNKKIPKSHVWTEEEVNYLREKIGVVSMSVICEKLGRSVEAVTHKAVREGIGSASRNTEYLTASDIARMLNVSLSTVIYSYIKKKGLKAMHISLSGKQKNYYVLYDWFIKWLKNNQDLWDSTKVELYAFGEEPKWLKEKRNSDLNAPKKRKQYTKEETAQLVSLYKMNVSQPEIARRLGRTLDSVEKKLHRLDVWGVRKDK